MDRDEREHVRALCGDATGIGPNIVTKALDALDAADRAAELAEGTIAALRDRLAEVERERDLADEYITQARRSLGARADEMLLTAAGRVVCERDEARAALTAALASGQAARDQRDEALRQVEVLRLDLFYRM